MDIIDKYVGGNNDYSIRGLWMFIYDNAYKIVNEPTLDIKQLIWPGDDNPGPKIIDDLVIKIDTMIFLQGKIHAKNLDKYDNKKILELFNINLISTILLIKRNCWNTHQILHVIQI